MSSLVLACSGTFDIAAPVNVATLEFLIQTVALNFWLGLATALFGPKLAVQSILAGSSGFEPRSCRWRTRVHHRTAKDAAAETKVCEKTGGLAFKAGALVGVARITAALLLTVLARFSFVVTVFIGTWRVLWTGRIVFDTHGTGALIEELTVPRVAGAVECAPRNQLYC